MLAPYLYPNIMVGRNDPLRYVCHQYMKNSFPKPDKRQSKELSLQCQCHVRRSCFRKELFIMMYTYTHIYLCENLLSKPYSWRTWHLHCQPISLECCLSRFGEQLFISILWPSESANYSGVPT